MRAFSIGILFFLLLPTRANAQWEAIGSFPHQIANVYFMSDHGHPEVGFVGMCRADEQRWLQDSVQDSADLWRTSDGGHTWQAVPLTTHFPGPYSSAFDITFKDSLNGWMTGQDCFHTTDGGATWKTFPIEDAITGSYYHPMTKLLFLSSLYINSIVSSDEGLTWNQFGVEHAGFAFTGLDGVVGADDYPNSYALYTSDGGVSWSQSSFKDECFQPVGIPGTATFFAASEHENRISRSDDGGKTWRTIFTYGPPILQNSTKLLSGCMRIDKCGNLYMQSSDEGILMSSDEGVSWRSIGGPFASADVRFWITDDYIYAGEGPTEGAGPFTPGKLWRYRLTPYLESTFADGSKRISMKAGDTISVYYTIPGVDNSPMDTMHLVVRYDDPLTLKNILIPPQWSILDSSVKNGVLDLWLVTNAQQLPSQLLSLNFGTVLETPSAKVYLDSNHLYGNRLSSDCAALSVAGPDSVEIDFTGCGDSTLLRYMSGQSPFAILSVQPNPAQSEIAVRTANADATTSSYALFDALGRRMLSGNVGATATLDVRALPSGLYYLRVTSNGFAQTRSVSIDR